MSTPIASESVPSTRAIMNVHVLYFIPRTNWMPRQRAKKAQKKALAPRLG